MRKGDRPGSRYRSAWTIAGHVPLVHALQIVIANSRIVEVVLRDTQLLDVPGDPVEGLVVCATPAVVPLPQNRSRWRLCSRCTA